MPKARAVPDVYATFLRTKQYAKLDKKRPKFLPMFGGDTALPTLHFVTAATDDFGDREVDLASYPKLFPLAWLRYGKDEEGAFVAIDGGKKACPVSVWWPEDGELYPLYESLELFVASLSAPATRRSSVSQLDAAHKKADALSDRDKKSEALAVLDPVLEGFAFTPTEDMALADDLIESVGECFRLRGTIAVLGPPYARKTALADAERDFRSAITWHSLGLSSPGFAYIGLIETLVFEASDYARALAELEPVLDDFDEYPTFYLKKARAFALLATGKVDAARRAYKELAKLASGGDDWADSLIEDLDTLAKRVPKQAAVAKAIKASRNAR